MMKTIVKINESKSWFFEKINKIQKPLERKKMDRIQINEIRNVKEVTRDTTEITKIISDYYQQLYDNKMDNLG